MYRKKYPPDPIKTPLGFDNAKYTVPLSPEEEDELSISGSEPDPEANDTLTAAHAVLEQLNEDEEHPKVIDIARDENKALEHDRTH